jgi:bifunctional DNA-binding transcriptional regulator/antitoxin component of YhaV-PrlF toxin-antitoxin module
MDLFQRGESVENINSDDIRYIEETTVTVRSYRHRTTVPSKIFKYLELKQGDSLRWIALKNGTIFIKKVMSPELNNDE